MGIAAFLFGGVVGLSLGLTGGGGSIFAVPLLVYGLGFPFRHAVAVSLGVVGVVAGYGAAIHARRGEVVWGAGIVLGIGGLLAAPVGASLGRLLSERTSLLLFAAVMLTVARQMMRARRTSSEIPYGWARCEIEPGFPRPRFSWRCAAKLLCAGGIVGILSGVFGVGGGFLLVPALLVVLSLPMERALATSLVSITIIAAAGFLSHLADLRTVDPIFCGAFLGGAILGITVGARIKSRFEAVQLRRIFGVLTVVAAFTVIALTLSR